MGLLSPTLAVKPTALFCDQLARMAAGDITIVRSLELLAEKAHASTIRRLASRLAQAMRGGATFGEAAYAEGRRLPFFFVVLISIGEHTGHLREVLQRLASYYEDQLRLKRAFLQAIMWLILLILVAQVGIPILIVVLRASPQTNVPLAVLRILVRFFAPILVLLAVLGLVNHVFPVKRVFLTLAYPLWPVRGLVRRFALARFGWGMHLLLGSGIPPERALQFAARTVEVAFIEREFLKAAPRVKAGMTLHEALAGCRYLSVLHRSYIEVGEASGRPEEAFRHIAQDSYDESLHIIRVWIFFVALVYLYYGAYVILRSASGMAP